MPSKEQFNIVAKTIEDIDCLYLKGYLDAHTAPDLEDAISQIISNGRKKILVNFSNLDYISSAGLGVFMAFIEDLREKDGDIKMSDMKPKVFSVFDLLGFPMLFEIFKEEKSAIERFQGLA
jgi:anti-sigma B factor antagonist